MKAMRKIGSAVARVINRPDADVLLLMSAVVVTSDPAFFVGINDLPVARIGRHEAALTTAGLKPILPSNRAPIRAAGDTDVGVVLLRAVDVIGECVVHGHVVKLRRGLIVLRRPGFAAIE